MALPRPSWALVESHARAAPPGDRGLPLSFEGSRRLSNGDKALSVQAELVARVVADAADLPVPREVARAPRDRRDAPEGEADAENAIACGAVIREGELRFHARA